jgi:hypothetical protein
MGQRTQRFLNMERRIRIIKGKEAIKAHMERKYQQFFFMAYVEKSFLLQKRELIFDRNSIRSKEYKYKFKFSFSAS